MLVIRYMDQQFAVVLEGRIIDQTAEKPLAQPLATPTRFDVELTDVGRSSLFTLESQRRTVELGLADPFCSPSRRKR